MSQMKVERDDNATRISVYMPWGFHGDQKLLKLVDTLVPNVAQFCETGTEAGSTVAYAARMYPHLVCHTVEADPGTHETAKANTANIPNIIHANGLSEEWLRDIDPAPALFWLDAHSHGWGCPLGKEVAIILERWPGGYILMDDFQVPHQEGFGFDWYNTFGKVNWETIRQDIPDESRITQKFYPNYQPFRGARGWMLLTFGDVPDVPIIDGLEMVRG